MNQGDTPGLIARPPLIYLSAMVAGLVLQRLWPVAVVPEAWEAPLGAPLILAAVLVFLLSVGAFRRAGTPIQSGSRPMLAIAMGVAVAAAAGCRTFDAESQRLEEVLGLAPGAVVADVGAGEGEWTLEMARRVGPSGRVFATEIDPERIGDLRRAVAEAGVANVTIIEGAPDDTNLPPGCCDAILLRHVYHHITHPEAMNASLLQALRPDGFLAVIDFGPLTRLLPVPDGVPENRRGHGMPIDVLVEELTSQGFAVAQRIDDWFRFDYCVAFQPRGAITSLRLLVPSRSGSLKGPGPWPVSRPRGRR